MVVSKLENNGECSTLEQSWGNGRKRSRANPPSLAQQEDEEDGEIEQSLPLEVEVGPVASKSFSRS